MNRQIPFYCIQPGNLKLLLLVLTKYSSFQRVGCSTDKWETASQWWREACQPPVWGEGLWAGPEGCGAGYGRGGDKESAQCSTQGVQQGTGETVILMMLIIFIMHVADIYSVYRSDSEKYDFMTSLSLSFSFFWSLSLSLPLFLSHPPSVLPCISPFLLFLWHITHTNTHVCTPH